MRAICIHRHGGSEVLSPEDIPEPVPGPGPAVIKTEAAVVNLIDIYHRTNLHPTDLPITNVQEGAGTVTGAASDVQDMAVGNRVVYCRTHGAYAKFAAVASDRLVSIPEAVATVTAAAVMLQGMTAYYLTRSTCKLDSSHITLTHACAGGVGLHLIAFAKKFGTRVFGTCSTAEKAIIPRFA